MKNIFLITILLALFGCSDIKYEIKQEIGTAEYTKKYASQMTTNHINDSTVSISLTSHYKKVMSKVSIITTAYYGDLEIYRNADPFDLKSDTIKCFRYNEALNVINQYKHFHNIKCK
jgi:hypothetical protein